MDDPLERASEASERASDHVKVGVHAGSTLILLEIDSSRETSLKLSCRRPPTRSASAPNPGFSFWFFRDRPKKVPLRIYDSPGPWEGKAGGAGLNTKMLRSHQ